MLCTKVALVAFPQTLNNLPELLNLPSEPVNLPLAIDCVELMLLKRREISLVRVGAFIKRLGEMVI